MYVRRMNATAVTFDQVARWFHALSDETRVRIVDLLATGEKCVCELQTALGAAQSRLSFHLKVLKDAGLVADTQAGTRRIYHVQPDGLSALRAELDRFWNQALATFKEVVEQGPEEGA
jgi:DNA-binding transcriptional ArsR family regulator